MRRVLICGVGQVGAFAARAIAKMGAHVMALDLNPSTAFLKKYGPSDKATLIVGDVLNAALVETLIEIHSIDTIVLSIGLNNENSKPNDDAVWKINVGSCESIAIAARKKRGLRVVFLSSFAVYGGVKANGLQEGRPLNPQSTYGRAKVAAENHLIRYHNRELDVRILRPCGIYGPRPNGTGSRSSSLIDMLLAHAINGITLTVRTSKDSADEYLYVKDLSRAIALTALQDTGSSDFIFNVGMGKKTMIPDLLSAVQHVIPASSFRVEIEPTNGSYEIPPLDVSRIRRAFGFGARYSLVEGLHDYLKTVSLPV